jgi:hypothetical protein
MYNFVESSGLTRLLASLGDSISQKGLNFMPIAHPLSGLQILLYMGDHRFSLSDGYESPHSF